MYENIRSLAVGWLTCK